LNVNPDTAHKRAQSLLARIDESSHETEEKSGNLETKDKFGIRHLNESRYIEHLDAIFDFDNSESESSGGHHDWTIVAIFLTKATHCLLGDRTLPRTVPLSKRLRHRWTTVKTCLDPTKFPRRLMDWLKGSFLLLAIPFWIIALFLFDEYENVELDFLPGNATLSWWANFIGKASIARRCACISPSRRGHLFDAEWWSRWRRRRRNGPCGPK
jgi:hypothetical protein